MPKRRSRYWKSSSQLLGVLSDDREGQEPLVRLWMLRMLVDLGGYKSFINTDDFADDLVARVLGLGHWIEAEDSFFPSLVQKELRQLYRSQLKELKGAKLPACLAQNIQHLVRRVGLSSVDARILAFAVMIHYDRALGGAADLLGQISTAKLNDALAIILGMPVAKVRAALSPKGVLQQSGLIVVDRNGKDELKEKLELISGHFPDIMMSPDTDPIDVLQDAIKPSAPASLTLADYDHICKQLAILKPLLSNAIKNKRSGTNIFLYGSPGTGKTQLVKALASYLRCELFEVASEDEDGDPITGLKRLRAYRAAQYFLGKRRNLMLFDEMEDVFCDGGWLKPSSTAQSHKAWVNHILETSPVPTLWLSNTARHLDPAFVRRFSMVVELPVPPARKRREIIHKACQGLLPPAHINRLAGSSDLAPALVAQTAAVVRSISDDLGEAALGDAFDLIINKTMETQGHQPIKRHDPNRLPEVYDPQLVNADTELTTFVTGLQATRAGRLCLYGPPGTGKTAFARYLAEQLEAPLVVKRGSDLLSMWVGGSEKNIARAFAEAEQEGALLLIDEVDSFLQDRRRAERQWQVSQVNEMLTQVEAFAGVFIASTNLVEGLDQASLRRFDAKVKFDYLLPSQAWLLFSKHCKQLKLRCPASLQRQLERLHKLTPGDFMTVIRRYRIQPLESAETLLQGLEQECSLKEDAKRPIGFV